MIGEMADDLDDLDALLDEPYKKVRVVLSVARSPWPVNFERLLCNTAVPFVVSGFRPVSLSTSEPLPLI